MGQRRAREMTKRSQFVGGSTEGEWCGAGGDREWRNKPNPKRVAERSQSGISKGVPAGMYHRLQCSAGREGISVKWLILFGELVVNKNRSMDH